MVILTERIYYKDVKYKIVNYIVEKVKSQYYGITAVINYRQEFTTAGETKDGLKLFKLRNL